jgi:hypothetical protein
MTIFKLIYKASQIIDVKYEDVIQIPLEVIANGTPLDDVKAEIEKQIERDFAFSETETLKVPCHYGIANGLQNAIRFLDSIESEEVEG